MECPRCDGIGSIYDWGSCDCCTCYTECIVCEGSGEVKACPGGCLELNDPRNTCSTCHNYGVVSKDNRESS